MQKVENLCSLNPNDSWYTSDVTTDSTCVCPPDQIQVTKKLGDKTLFKCQLSSNTSTVDSVDAKKRIVVLKDANGNLVQMNVSKQINDLEKVKKGDIFVVEHAQAIAVGLTAAGKDAKPGVSGVRSITVAAKGSAKPFEEVTDTVYATVKISTIDAKSRIVTFTMPNGEKQKVKVDQSVLGLEKFKAGDDVMIEFVDDTALGFVTPKK
jgi:hypothetical protein